MALPDGSKQKNVRICEGSFLHLIGLTSTLNASSATRVWKSIVEEFRNPQMKGEEKQEAEEVPAFRDLGRKSNHARKWILRLARFYGDFFATEEGVD